VNIPDWLITGSIVMALSLLWRFWPNLFKRKTKPVPRPEWNGKHEIAYVKHVTRYERIDDYYVGWVWACTCGTTNENETYEVLPQRESLAVFEWIAHRDLYAGMDRSFGG
jgi:hypothetical protein